MTQVLEAIANTILFILEAISNAILFIRKDAMNICKCNSYTEIDLRNKVYLLGKAGFKCFCFFNLWCPTTFQGYWIE